MSKETAVMIAIVTGSLITVVIFTRTEQIRKAFFAYLVGQLVSWPLSLGMVYMQFLENPVRLFAKATDNSFVIAYILNPVSFALYCIHYPKQALVAYQLAYTFLITSALAFVHLIIERHTELLHYINWSYYSTLLVGFISFYMLRRYVDWFFSQWEQSGREAAGED